MKRMVILLSIIVGGTLYANEMGAGSGSSYPSVIDTDSSLETPLTEAREDVPNDTNDAVVKMETELGVSPKGGHGTVRARLDAVSVSTAALAVSTTSIAVSTGIIAASTQTLAVNVGLSTMTLLPLNGSRAMTGPLTMGASSITATVIGNGANAISVPGGVTTTSSVTTPTVGNGASPLTIPSPITLTSSCTVLVDATVPNGSFAIKPATLGATATLVFLDGDTETWTMTKETGIGATLHLQASVAERTFQIKNKNGVVVWQVYTDTAAASQVTNNYRQDLTTVSVSGSITQTNANPVTIAGTQSNASSATWTNCNIGLFPGAGSSPQLIVSSGGVLIKTGGYAATNGFTMDTYNTGQYINLWFKSAGVAQWMWQQEANNTFTMHSQTTDKTWTFKNKSGNNIYALDTTTSTSVQNNFSYITKVATFGISGTMTQTNSNPVSLTGAIDSVGSITVRGAQLLARRPSTSGTLVNMEIVCSTGPVAVAMAGTTVITCGGTGFCNVLVSGGLALTVVADSSNTFTVSNAGLATTFYWQAAVLP